VTTQLQLINIIIIIIIIIIVRRSNCVPLPIVVCPVVGDVMLENRVASCVHCVENVPDVFLYGST